MNLALILAPSRDFYAWSVRGDYAALIHALPEEMLNEVCSASHWSAVGMHWAGRSSLCSKPAHSPPRSPGRCITGGGRFPRWPRGEIPRARQFQGLADVLAGCLTYGAQ